jgi:hypothetical protein
MSSVRDEALGKGAARLPRRGKQYGKKGWWTKEGFFWPDPDPEKYPDQKCSCGGTAKHNGFPGEYSCEDCGESYVNLP